MHADKGLLFSCPINPKISSNPSISYSTQESEKKDKLLNRPYAYDVTWYSRHVKMFKNI